MTMLRDSVNPQSDGFVRHGTDVETLWADDVPYVTPNERFFVRNHTRPPPIDGTSWRLLVGGDGVTREASYSLDELKELGATTLECALECTGNGRRYFAEQQGIRRPGTQWGTGAVGLARWTGVPLGTVLQHTGLARSVCQVMGVGLDEPYVEDGVDHGRVRRPLPIDKALDDVLVAWEMNGVELPADHGYPARLVVPGWVGIASIKWLGSLQVSTAEMISPWNTRWYRMSGKGRTGAEPPLTRMPVKSTLDAVDQPEVGRYSQLRGRAWSGEASVAYVEVSTDGGETWDEAVLTGDNRKSCWVGWEFGWIPRTSGRHDVLVRATDSDGRRQPERAADNDHGYLFDAVLRYRVSVEAGGQVVAGITRTGPRR